MKQIFMIYILFSGIPKLTAKEYHHLPVVGNVIKQQVEYLDFSHDDLSPIWDLSKLQKEQDNYLLNYGLNPVDDKILIGTEHNTRYCYQCCSDSVLLWGYENHTSKIEYDLPELIYKENLGLGNHVDGVFHGLEFYGGRLSFRLFGAFVHQYKWYAEGYRYPIYETITTGTSSTPKLYELAFYCSPEEQVKEYDVANEKVRAIMTKNQGYVAEAEGSREGSHGDSNITTIGISGKMNTNGSLSVCLDVTKTGYADIMVYTADGLLVSSQTNVFLSQGRKSYSYDVSNYKSDVYIVTCIVDGTKTSTKVTGNGNDR